MAVTWTPAWVSNLEVATADLATVEVRARAHDVAPRGAGEVLREDAAGRRQRQGRPVRPGEGPQLARAHARLREGVVLPVHAIEVGIAVVEARQVQHLVSENPGAEVLPGREGAAGLLPELVRGRQVVDRWPAVGVRLVPVDARVDHVHLVVVEAPRGLRGAEVPQQLEPDRVSPQGALPLVHPRLGLGRQIPDRVGHSLTELGAHARRDGELDPQGHGDRAAHLLVLELERNRVALAAEALGLQLDEPALGRLLEREVTGDLGRWGAAPGRKASAAWAAAGARARARAGRRLAGPGPRRSASFPGLPSVSHGRSP